MSGNQTETEFMQQTYKNVFLGNSTAQEGMLVLMDLIDRCKIFMVNAKDPHADAVLAGKRAIGIQLFFMIGLTPVHGGQVDLLHLAQVAKVMEEAHNLLEIFRHKQQQMQKEKEDNE